MYAVMRTYTGKGAKELFDVLEANQADVEKVIRSVKGFVSYLVFRIADGGVTVTVCLDKSGADQSVQLSKDWVQRNASHVTPYPPALAGGPVIMQMQ